MLYSAKIPKQKVRNPLCKNNCFMLVAVLSTVMLVSASWAESVTVKSGTEVLVKVMERIKSNKIKRGQTIQLLVERAVKNESGFTVIEQGAFAYGTITKASSAGLFGTGGELAFTVDSVEAYNGKVIPLTANKESDGSNSTGAVVAGALLVSPLAIFFRGTNAVVEAGTIFRAYVSQNTVLSADLSETNTTQSVRFEGNTETDKRLSEMLRQYENKK